MFNIIKLQNYLFTKHGTKYTLPLLTEDLILKTNTNLYLSIKSNIIIVFVPIFCKKI